MEHARTGDLLIVRLDRGDSVIDALLAALHEHKARGAVVLTGLGAFEDVEFAYYDPVRKAYDRKVVSNSHEVLSLSGIIAISKEGQYQPHFHIALAGPDHVAVGGHLFKATVSVLAEFALRLVELPAMRREKEPDSALMGLRLG